MPLCGKDSGIKEEYHKINEVFVVGDRWGKKRKEYMKSLFDYLGKILYEPEREDLNPVEFPEEFDSLAQGIAFLSDTIKEIYDFSVNLSNGELDQSPSKDNPLAGPLKDLQANLRHLTWQTAQIAAGDYDQRVDYLGEFSKSFNTMTEQLKLREKLLIDNANLEKQAVSAKNLVLEQGLDYQLEHYDRVNQLNQEMRKFRHDMKNHFLCISNFIKDGKDQDALDYIQSISTGISSQADIVNTGNYLFDALLSDKIYEAEGKKIKVDHIIRVRPDIKIANVDWVVLFGNALDNAIEANERMPEEQRFLTIHINSSNNVLNVQMKNPVDEEKLSPDETGEGFISTKGKDPNHGLGLKNIFEVVDKYHGVHDIEVKDGIFTLTLMLCDV